MIDISVADSSGLEVVDTQVYRASNCLAIQVGSLEYAPEFGIDLRYFLTEGFRFQNESFKGYLVERLASRGINVASIVDTIENLFTQYTFNVSPEETSTAMVAR